MKEAVLVERAFETSKAFFEMAEKNGWILDVIRPEIEE